MADTITLGKIPTWLWIVPLILVPLLIVGYFLPSAGEKQTGRTLPSITTRFRPGAPPPTPAEYENIISVAAEKWGVDANLVKAVIQRESQFIPDAVGKKGEKGLMQLMPETATRYGVTDPFDPVQSVDGGTHYLSDLLQRYGGDVKKALSAYNSGEDNVDKGTIPLVTRNEYVPAVLGWWERFRGGAPIPEFTGAAGTMLAMAATPGKVLETTTEVTAMPNQWSKNISIPSNARFRIEPNGKIQIRFWDGKIVNDEPGKETWFKDCIRNGNFRVMSREDHDVKVTVNVGPV